MTTDSIRFRFANHHHHHHHHHYHAGPACSGSVRIHHMSSCSHMCAAQQGASHGRHPMGFSLKMTPPPMAVKALVECCSRIVADEGFFGVGFLTPHSPLHRISAMLFYLDQGGGHHSETRSWKAQFSFRMGFCSLITLHRTRAP